MFLNHLVKPVFLATGVWFYFSLIMIPLIFKDCYLFKTALFAEISFPSLFSDYNLAKNWS